MLALVLPPSVERPNLFLVSKNELRLDKKRNKFALFNFLSFSHFRSQNLVVLTVSVLFLGVIQHLW